MNLSSLHHFIISHIIEQGHAPSMQGMTAYFGKTEAEVVKGLYELQDYHGAVLHPNSPKVWVIHPFSLAPTNFVVESARGLWWGNCAWCSLGVAALLQEDLTITTSLGAHGKQVVIRIVDGKLDRKDLYIHFPIPMKNAWDNVIYTCSNMLVFESEAQVNDWCQHHDIPKGDLQPIDNIWQFSKKWYGNHLNPEWKKWTISEAKSLFAQYQLNHPVWQLEDAKERF